MHSQLDIAYSHVYFNLKKRKSKQTKIDNAEMIEMIHGFVFLDMTRKKMKKFVIMIRLVEEVEEPQ